MADPATSIAAVPVASGPPSVSARPRFAKPLTTILLILVAGGALVARLPGLSVRPPHGDEANQFIRFQDLWENGRYVYDPHEFHGPTLYYATLPAFWLSGVRDFRDATEADFRIVTVVFGAATLLLMLGVADGLGRLAAVVAAVLCALSPALVFYSRYYIQEPLLLFFTFATIVCGWRLTQASGSRAMWAVLGGLSVGLMHATKETWVIAAFAMAGGVAMAAMWARLVDGAQGQSAAVRLPAKRALLLAVAVAAAVAFVFYSSFFTHWEGPWDSIRAFGLYMSRRPGLHDHPWDWYLGQLVGWTSFPPYARHDPVCSELLILVLAGLGVIAALMPARWNLVGPLARFIAFYTLIATAVYSAVSYKTPWCMITFLHGMVLLAGVGVAAVVRLMPLWPAKALVFAPLVWLGLPLARQFHRLNFAAPYCFDERRNPYIYAHSHADVLRLAQRMERLAAAHPRGRSMPILFFTHDYWPLPWYLRRFDQVDYGGEIPAGPLPFAGAPDGPVIVASADDDAAITPKLRPATAPSTPYVAETFSLRRQVLVTLYVDRTLWDRMVALGPKARLP